MPWEPDFRLTDPSRQSRALSDFRGKVVMLYFGYIHCTDECPAARAFDPAFLGLRGEQKTTAAIAAEPGMKVDAMAGDIAQLLKGA